MLFNSRKYQRPIKIDVTKLVQQNKGSSLLYNSVSNEMH